MFPSLLVGWLVGWLVSLGVLVLALKEFLHLIVSDRCCKFIPNMENKIKKQKKNCDRLTALPRSKLMIGYGTLWSQSLTVQSAEHDTKTRG